MRRLKVFTLLLGLVNSYFLLNTKPKADLELQSKPRPKYRHDFQRISTPFKSADNVPENHPVFQTFVFKHFPDINTRNAVAYLLIEAIDMIRYALPAINHLDDDPYLKTTYQRYFGDDQKDTVRKVLEGLIRQVGAPLYDERAPQCVPLPELRPLTVWYDSPPSDPDLCSRMIAGVIPGPDPSGQQTSQKTEWLLVCPSVLDDPNFRLIRDIDPYFVGSTATFYGTATLRHYRGAGMWTSSAILMHELLHWFGVTERYAGVRINDETFVPTTGEFSLPTEARTPWLAMQLKRQSPNLCVGDMASYFHFSG